MTGHEPGDFRGGFRLRPEHLALLQQSYVGWNPDYSEGAPGIGLKRPYGNSDVEGDVAEIVAGERARVEAGLQSGYTDRDDYIDFDSEGEIKRVRLPDGRVLTRAELMRFHYETAVALQIILSTGSFEPGFYRMPRPFSTNEWVRVPDEEAPSE